jgi:transcriptional regulator with XRE-family HTH domain
MPELTGADARRLRNRQGWSLQFLAHLSGVNKAYLSEFENGFRQLPPEMLERVANALERQFEGSAIPRFRVEDGHSRLIFVTSTGELGYEPPAAWLEWVEADGRVMRMWVGPLRDD